MGLFDALRDVIRPDGDPGPVDGEGRDMGQGNGRDGEAKHVDRSAPPEVLDDPLPPDTPAGGKHARRD